LAEEIRGGREAGPGAGVEFVPFAVVVAEQEWCVDDEFGVDPVALVGIEGGEVETDLVVECGSVNMATD
jgi:hypothetical protein